MSFDNCMSWLEAASPASPASHDETLDNRGQASRYAATPALSITAPPFSPPKGTWFDESIDVCDPEGGLLARRVIALVTTLEKRKRRRSVIAEANHYIIVRKILANGLRCYHYRRPAWVSYLRKADGYKGKPAWFSGTAMARTVDLLAAAGLLETSAGDRGTASTYRITKKLVILAEACGISGGSFVLPMPPERLVRLRRGNSKSPQVDFNHDDETRLWTALLDEYNVFARQQDITITLTEAEEVQWVRHWNQERAVGGLPLLRPERFRTDLYRQFNNGSFEEGGRLYGGWWQHLPKELRHRIQINGEPTIELDYAGCAIRMLYHQRGIDYRDDPYELPAIIAFEKELGLPSGHYRNAIKAITQALINDRSGDQPEQIQLPKGLSFRPAFQRKAIRRMIEEKHFPIADAFGTGAGLRLQRRDSDLALTIVTSMKEQAALALPIHDSFIAIQDEGKRLKAVMDNAYVNSFGFKPIIH